MADDFQVVPDDLDKYAGSLRDLAGQADAATKHANKWLDLADADMVIYSGVKKVVDQIRQNFEANYKHLQALSDGSAAEMAKTAQVYRTHDTDWARRLDATYPEAGK